MEASITLWKCPPLRARITQRQCALNRARAGDSASLARSAFGALAQGPLQCVGCRGLEWWAEQTGEIPQRVSTPDLAREHLRKDEERRRLGGLPPAAPARGVVERRRRRDQASA